jgi:hypothetical protein
MIPRKIPRGCFWIGGLLGVALGLPLTTLALTALAERMRFGRLDATQAQIGILALIFAGLPAFLTGGGVGRLVAHRIAEAPKPSTGRAVGIGALAMAAGGIGIAVLCAVPLGGLPDRSTRWWPLAAAGALCGALCGAAIGVLVGARVLRHRARALAAASANL